MSNAERWNRVKDIFDTALDRPPETRLSFVREQCGTDGALYADVQSLLAAHEGAGPLFARPAIHALNASAVAAIEGALEERSRVLRPGDLLGPYEVTEFLGAGGMGEVYRARDTTLGRDVAIKVLPDLFLHDTERLVRFEREARLLATLNHSNIATVHGFEDRPTDAGRRIRGLVMEMVEGETIAESLARAAESGPGLPVREALIIARQVANALDAAHERGIIHRDLKPGNIKVTQKGIVKVLDFGLAKISGADAPSVTATQAPVLSVGHTELGMLLGTVPYMSPEQARGTPVDTRTDIWAFGCLLYELLTGRPPFSGETTSDTIARILERDPDWHILPPETPDGIRDLLRGCLTKNPDGRIQKIASVRGQIEEAIAVDERPVVARPMHRSVWRLPFQWALAAVSLFAGGYVAYRMLIAPDMAVPRLSNPMQVTAAIGLEDYPTWSPDGRTLAFESGQGGNWDIWMSQPGGETALNRTADHHGDDRYPSWSPDGRQIAFWSSQHGGGYFVMPAVGGAASKLASTPGTTAPYHGPAEWSADGVELAYVNYRPVGMTLEASLEIVSTLTRETRRFPLPGLQQARLDLSWSRDGSLMAYLDAAQPTAETTQIRVLRLSDGRVVDITDARANARSPRWSPDGGALYFISNRAGAADLWWQRVDRDGNPLGEPRQVTSGLEVLHVNLLSTGAKLAYTKGRWVSNIWRVPIQFDHPATWADAEQITFEQAFIEMVDVSRDGSRIFFSSDRSGNQDLWSMPIGGEATRLTRDPAPEWAPALSPDQREVGFYSNRTGDREIWIMPAEGGPARQLTHSEGLDAGFGWSPDGREIAFRSERLGSSDVWVMNADGSNPRVLAPHPASDYSPDFSPDGRWLAFGSTRGGTPQIWLVPRGGGEPQLLTPGSGLPTWSRDGAHVFFVRTTAGLANLWSVSVETRLARPLTNLTGRRGTLGVMGTATDGKFIYFTWRDDVGDIWVADINLGP